MKKVNLFLAAIMLFAISCEKNDISEEVSMKEFDAKVKTTCATIPDGTIYSNGVVITTGYNDAGYNYQAHMYNGDYYGDGTKLIMVWNDAWLSNKDCGTQIGREGAFSDPFTPDGKLDRHYPYDSYRGSGAWLTNHEEGTDQDGNHYTYFVKIVAVPTDAYLENGLWMTVDGIEIGPNIWGSFAIIQEQYMGNNGESETYRSKFKSGLGNW